MLGDGPERASAQALGRRLGVADRIRYLGTRQGTADVASLADVFLLPSEIESFGLSALEALAAQTPVVGSDAGGLPEVVKHGETGFLLPVGDIEGMAARTHRDPEGRRTTSGDGPRRPTARRSRSSTPTASSAATRRSTSERSAPEVLRHSHNARYRP